MDIQTICETLGVTEEKAKELIRKCLAQNGDKEE